ncbi:arylsulfatase [Algibacter pectinivorans]|uniref:Arylsulfatase A n=1 Tax=Algibacter pectinivorans TaxID=870482 RepID=A0A1I1R2K6_9FLAO|nr:arylsulfatase [Algibacter pectinivorans]SFD24490.1 Arylsulfatase A [Algibacter pectinivorans]
MNIYIKNKTKSINAILVLMVVFCQSCKMTTSEKDNKQALSKPNIIYILADDMGYGDLGSYGQKIIKTPVLDRMASEGIRFTEHYSGSTVCAPSRGVLMTGLNTAHAYIRGNFSIQEEGNLAIPENTITVAKLLNKGGYNTGVIGKWGLGGPKSVGGPNSQGFDYSFCYLDQRNAHEYYPNYLWENEEKYVLEKNANNQELQYSHDLFTGKALNFIKEHKESPFFLYLPYTIPHGKYQVPDDAPYTDLDMPQPIKNYAAMITRMDSDIGKIINQLKAYNIDENTIIIFSSDNGPTPNVNKYYDSNGPSKGFKRDLYEGGIKAPMIVRWPSNIKPGTTSNLVSDFSDFLPTACDIAGIETPKNIDGISFVNELQGKEQKEHDFLYWEFFKYNYGWKVGDDPKKRNAFESQALRMGKWKAVRQGIAKNPKARLELYDLTVDKGETNNVAKMYPEIVKKIEQLMHKTRFDVEYFVME